MKKFKAFRLSKFQPDKQVGSILYSESVKFEDGESSIEEKGRISTKFGDFVIIGSKDSVFNTEQINNIDIDFGDDAKFF